MVTRMTTPPTLRELLQIPAYRKYFTTIPALTIKSTAPMWQVWIATSATDSHEGHSSFRWKGGKFHTYREAYSVVAKALKAKDSTTNKPKYYDMCITSRIQLFTPPVLLTPDLSLITATHNRLATYVSESLDWCGRCRRPSTFEWAMRSHHALRSAPAITTDDPYRCFYCGIRKIAMPRYKYQKESKESLMV